MPASKKPAEKRVVRDEDVAVPTSKVDRLDPDGLSAVRDGEDYGKDQNAAANRQTYPSLKRGAVSFTENVLTVDLTALETLSQGERQVAVKTARTVLDRANQ